MTKSLDVPADFGLELRHAVQVAAVVGVQARARHLLRGDSGPAHDFVGELIRLGEMRPDSRMLVLTNVGHSTVTLTPVPDNSAARVSDSDSTPALLTL